MKAIALLSAFLVGVLSTLTFVGFTTADNEGYILEHEQDIAKQEPGPHKGGGLTTAYPFFSKAENMQLVFRKRVLRAGSSIGYHLQEKDEIYYVLEGHGELSMNGKTIPVKEGDAVITRPGSWHGIKPTGNDSLTILINYNK